MDRTVPHTPALYGETWLGPRRTSMTGPWTLPRPKGAREAPDTFPAGPLASSVREIAHL